MNGVEKTFSYKNIKIISIISIIGFIILFLINFFLNTLTLTGIYIISLLLCVLPSILLLIPNKTIRNSHVVGLMCIFFILIVLFWNFGWFFNTSEHLSLLANVRADYGGDYTLYNSEIWSIKIRSTLLFLYAFYNLFCSYIFFIQTETDENLNNPNFNNLNKNQNILKINFCPFCGYKLKENNKFCPNCGKNMKEV